jgi:hypothetical protein
MQAAAACRGIVGGVEPSARAAASLLGCHHTLCSLIIPLPLQGNCLGRVAQEQDFVRPSNYPFSHPHVSLFACPPIIPPPTKPHPPATNTNAPSG